MLHTEQDFLRAVERDRYMMEVLKAVRTLKLPDCWVSAGFVRSKIWDIQHGFSNRTELPDIDVIYFDEQHTDERTDRDLEKILKEGWPAFPWSVKNQARMHKINNLPPYTSSSDAIARFPETATALGLRIDHNNELHLLAPYGLEDAISLNVKPTPYFSNKPEAEIYAKRLQKKNWGSKWSRLTFFDLKTV